MSTITKERLQKLIRAIDCGSYDEEEIVELVNSDEILELARIALASLEAEPVALEWTNKQCLEFLSIAFRHAEIKGDLELDDIRLGVKMVNGCRAATLQGAENAESRCSIQAAPALDSSPKIAKSRCSNSTVITDGWVACSERMPEVGAKVLCFPVNDEPIHATYNGQLWLQDISWSTSDEPIDNVISCNVFHWMSLPAAPQQEVK